MLYGRMMTRDHLIGIARPALQPLLEAYEAQRKQSLVWRHEMDATGPAAMRRWFDHFQNVGLFAIAACIALLADNISRIYCGAKIGDERKRSDFGGELVQKVTFGQVLRAAGNAARHYDGRPLYDLTENTLHQLEIGERDESMPFLLLERAGIRTLDDVERILNAICDDADRAAAASP